MKVIPIISHYEQQQTSLTQCLVMSKGEGSDYQLVVAITSLDQPIEVDGVVYRPGTEFGEIVATSGLSVDNLELTVIPDDDEALEADLLAGKWDNCDFQIFEVNFRDVDAGTNLLKRGTTGVATLNEGSWKIELRGIKQALQQPITFVTSKTCRYRLFSTSMPDGLCFVDPAGFTFSGSVTSVVSSRQFTDSGLTQDDGYFQEGSIVMLDGDNAGYQRKVKLFESGEITLSSPFPFAVLVGDTFTIQAGCQKRLTEDCIGKFDNVLNFGGEPHIKGTDALTKDPETGQ